MLEWYNLNKASATLSHRLSQSIQHPLKRNYLSKTDFLEIGNCISQIVAFPTKLSKLLPKFLISLQNQDETSSKAHAFWQSQCPVCKKIRALLKKEFITKTPCLSINPQQPI